MIKIEDKIQCSGCHACYNICPKNAIEMIEDEKGFKYPSINKEKCIECGICEKTCPIIKNKTIENNPIAYACYNKDEEIRKNSSSGGIFSLIATNIIEKGGVVFGASFDNTFNVKHMLIETKEELEKLRGSKYVQSDIGKTYEQAKKFLEEDKTVLFTGTPCQIEGLKAYLKKEYDNLYTQDIICHGVPSPKVWERYREYRKNKDKKEPIKINFRNKDNGWKYFNLKFEYQNKKYYKKNQMTDLFMKVFLQNLCLRDSCYKCSFKKYNRLADITLADFWGIHKILPKMNDDKGISLVIINSTKGKELLENIKNNIQMQKVDIEEALKFNPAMTKSAKENANRENFFKDIQTEEFDIVAKRYLKRPNIGLSILRKIKQIIT